MKFWKLEVNGNDFLLFYKDHKEVNKVVLCSERMGAGAHGWIEVRIQNETIQVQIYSQEGSESRVFYDGIRCCAYWYMVLFEKELCTIHYQKQEYRLKRWLHLVTLEVTPQYEDCAYIMDKKDAMHFYFPDMAISDPNAYISNYCYGIQHDELHRIAVGYDQIGKNVMRLSNQHVYISAAVHMIYEGQLFQTYER